jgi:demethylmenaquinone methyltransferase/2-methoxy-6-polyprenyl-1,4-benzoquinol methylase
MIDPIRAYFEELADRWDAIQPPNRADLLREFITPMAAEFTDADLILEIGTGTGALIPIMRQCAPHAWLVSIDVAYKMVEHAKARTADAPLLQADVHALPFEQGGAFDLVLCHNSFPHFADKPAALAEMRRVLRPTGWLYIVHSAGRERINAIHRQASPAIQNDLLPPGPQLAAMLSAAGFDGVTVEDAEDHFIAKAQCPPQPRELTDHRNKIDQG